MASIGDLIKVWRLRAGFTQSDLAHRSEVSTSTIQKIEADKHEPSRATLRPILEVLGRTLAELDAAREAAGTPRIVSLTARQLAEIRAIALKENLSEEKVLSRVVEAGLTLNREIESVDPTPDPVAQRRGRGPARPR